MLRIDRFLGNPILSPDPQNIWEADSVFNGCVVEDNNSFHMVYRAVSAEKTVHNTKMKLSTIGHGVSTDRCHFSQRRQLVIPEHDWERYGCEDPRVTKLEGKYYIFYTALSGYPPGPENIKVGVAISRDLVNIDEKHLVTTFNSKAMGLFPEKINGKFNAILTVDTDKPPAKICLAQFHCEEAIWNKDRWDDWYNNIDKHVLPLLRDPRDQVEVGAQPVKTDHGWLIIYCYIVNYFSPNKIFGIEAVLLDMEDPYKIIGRTKEPIMVPEKDYELYGKVPNVIFPSGALVHSNILGIYYGAADTSCALATCNLHDLMQELRPINKKLHQIQRSFKMFKKYPQNPIIRPIHEHNWESKLAFNAAAIYEGEKVHILYRAMGDGGVSVLGYASSSDGVNIDERLAEPVYIPRESFEKRYKGGDCGCEDPRITRIDERLYMCYTAYDGTHPTRVALTSISVSDFLEKKWTWDKPVLISAPDIDDKNSCVLSQKVNGKYVFMHRLQTSIWMDFKDDLNFGPGNWLWGEAIMYPRENKWDSLKIGIGPPPFKSKYGWLLIYHGLSKYDGEYRLGAAILDKDNPAKVIARLDDPILEPDNECENKGLRPGTVFSCGAVLIGGTIYVYYGGADQVVCVASVDFEKLQEEVIRHKI